MTEESILRRGRGRAGRAPQLGFADEGDDKADEAVDDEDEDEDEATPAWVEEPSANGAAEGEDLLPSTLVQPPGAIEAGRPIVAPSNTIPCARLVIGTPN